MLRPRSLSARLFAATALVSVIALLVGVWLVRRVVRLELNEQVKIVGRAADGEAPVSREIVREIVTPTGGAVAQQSLDHRLIAALAFVLAGSAIATALITRRV